MSDSEEELARKNTIHTDTTTYYRDTGFKDECEEIKAVAKIEMGVTVCTRSGKLEAIYAGKTFYIKNEEGEWIQWNSFNKPSDITINIRVSHMWGIYEDYPIGNKITLLVVYDYKSNEKNIDMNTNQKIIERIELKKIFSVSSSQQLILRRTEKQINFIDEEGNYREFATTKCNKR